MGNQLIDLTDKRFGKLTVLNIAGANKHKQRTWDCICECGNKTNVTGQHLRIGKTKSCGCGQTKIKHGMAGTPIYKVWSAMIQRTTNIKNTSYKDYGGRGITVCDEWLKFEKFYNDMGDSSGLTLDRKNNNKGYYKDNCRWATRKEQANNIRSNKVLTINGKSRTVSEWSDISKINYDTIIDRLKNNWDDKKAVFSKVQDNKTGNKFVRPVIQFDKQGNKIQEFKSATEAWKKTGISKTGIGYSANKIRVAAGGYILKFKELT